MLGKLIGEAAGWTGKQILKGAVGASYPICLTIAMGASILYIAGMKKAGKYVSISTVVFIFLQAMKAVIL